MKSLAVATGGKNVPLIALREDSRPCEKRLINSATDRATG